jgi:hypothetical protein
VKFLRTAFVIALSSAAFVATAAEQSSPALNMQTFFSSDKDGFETFKTTATADFGYQDPEHYCGIALQRARYNGPGFAATYNRAYLSYADGHDNGDGTFWKWNTLLGGDGRTLLGNAEIYREHADGSREDLFLEREMVETRDGSERGLYYTMLGVAKDFTFNPRWSATGMAAGQDFTGNNTRVIAKGRLVYLLSEDWGITAQLRTRWFHDSRPHEYDYFSPRWFAEWIPTLQMRRFYNRNQFLVALGYGRQHASDNGWTPTKLAEAGWTSPKRGSWYAKINAGYTNTPSNTGYGYAYRYINAQLVVPLR